MELGSLGLFQSHMQQLWGVFCKFFCDGDNGGEIPKKGARCFTDHRSRTNVCLRTVEEGRGCNESKSED